MAVLSIHRAGVGVAFALLPVAVLAACGPTTPAGPTAVLPTLTTGPVTALPTAVPTQVPATGAPTLPSGLPSGTIALYAQGAAESRLYALRADGASVDMGQTVGFPAAVSRSGRWLAFSSTPPPLDNTVVLVDLQSGTRTTYQGMAEAPIHGMAFDRAESRLVYAQVGPLGTEGTPWALDVVNLADGSVRRFSGTARPAEMLLPGVPLGWSASGDELFLDTFYPYSDGVFAGVWGMFLPPDAGPDPIEQLKRREIVPGGSYRSSPRFSPDSSQLLYLARDPSYTPANFEPVAFDFAVNQLWTARLQDGGRTRIVNVNDGGALAAAAAWSPDGTAALFARGSYSGTTFNALALEVRDASGAVREVGPLPLPGPGFVSALDWCAADVAVAILSLSDGTQKAYLVQVSNGQMAALAVDGPVTMLGCVP